MSNVFLFLIWVYTCSQVTSCSRIHSRTQCSCKATFKSVRKCKTNAKMHVKCIMWTCRRTAFSFICLCDVCLANRRMLSVWSRYFKEKYVHIHIDVDVHSFMQPMNNQRNACSFAFAANTEQATFWHSFVFA